MEAVGGAGVDGGGGRGGRGGGEDVHGGEVGLGVFLGFRAAVVGCGGVAVVRVARGEVVGWGGGEGAVGV